MNFNIDKSINKMLGKNKSFSNMKMPTSSIMNMRMPTSSISRMPSMKNVMKNFGLKQFGGKNDLDFDGVINKKDCQPRNTMRQDWSGKTDTPISDYPEEQGPESFQSLFYAGNVSPSEHIRQKGYVYGFSNLRFAEAWAKKHNYPYVYTFITNNYRIDERQYVRDTAAGKEYSDNEYIAGNVINEQLLGSTGKVLM